MRTRARQNFEVDDATASLFLNLEDRHLASDSQLPSERCRKSFRHSVTESEQIGQQDDNIFLSAADINKITVNIPLASELAK